mgnify:CR=1 FL=1
MSFRERFRILYIDTHDRPRRCRDTCRHHQLGSVASTCSVLDFYSTLMALAGVPTDGRWPRNRCSSTPTSRPVSSRTSCSGRPTTPRRTPRAGSTRSIWALSTTSRSSDTTTPTRTRKATNTTPQPVTSTTLSSPEWRTGSSSSGRARTSTGTPSAAIRPGRTDRTPPDTPRP